MQLDILAWDIVSWNADVDYSSLLTLVNIYLGEDESTFILS